MAQDKRSSQELRQSQKLKTKSNKGERNVSEGLGYTAAQE